MARIVALALLALACCAPAAGAADKVFKADYLFRVSVEGMQTTTWTSQDAGLTACFDGERGEGTQVVKFSSKPVTMHAYEGVPQPFFFKKGDRGGLELALRGTIDRRSSIACEGVPTPESDCGTKALTGMKVMPRYLYRRDRVVLDQNHGNRATSFAACPIYGDDWPNLLVAGRDLPASKLFGRRKTVLRAQETSEHADGASTAATTIRWALTFTRVSKHRLR